MTFLRHHQRNETGAIAGVEGVAFGVLVFVFGTLMIVNAWAVVDAKLATSAASREAARAYVEAGSAGEASSNAQASATETMSGYNRNASAVTVTASDPQDHFRRCESIVATVSTRLRAVPIPLLGSKGGTYTVTSRHSEVVDPYRAGLDGNAQC